MLITLNDFSLPHCDFIDWMRLYNVTLLHFWQSAFCVPATNQWNSLSGCSLISFLKLCLQLFVMALTGSGIIYNSSLSLFMPQEVALKWKTVIYFLYSIWQWHLHGLILYGLFTKVLIVNIKVCCCRWPVCQWWSDVWMNPQRKGSQVEVKRVLMCGLKKGSVS